MRLRLLLCIVVACASMPAPAKTVYRLETVAGTANTGDGGPALNAQISAIQGLAVDASGNIYISDTSNHRVRRVAANGIISTFAGTGKAGFSGDEGSAAKAQLNLPYGLAVDAAGNLYIADLGNGRVRRVGADGIIHTIAGGSDLAAPEGSAKGARLADPRDVVIDAAGNLYIAEFSGHRVRKVTPDGQIATIAGTGTAGLSGDGGPAAAAQLAYPAGLALDAAGALYVADSQNLRIRKVTLDGNIDSILGEKTADTIYATAVAVAVAGGTVYVGEIGREVAVSSRAGVWTSSIPAVTPSALTFDNAGTLYVADGAQVYQWNGRALQIVAGDGYAHVGDGGSASDALLLSPSGLALDPAGNLYIADKGTHRIRQVSAGGQIRTVAGTGTAGFTGDGKPAESARINTPMGVAVDSAGSLVIADTGNNRVRMVSAEGLIDTVAGTGKGGTTLNTPQGVCTGPGSVLHVVDTANHRILRLADGEAGVTEAGNGSADSIGDGGPATQAVLNLPWACAVDPGGNLIIADTAHHRVRRVTPSGSITTLAGTGTAGFSGDGGPAMNAQLSGPAGVAVDAAGNLYIADMNNQRVRLVSPDGFIQTIAGPENTLQAPSGLAVDASGRVYVADSGSNFIYRLVPRTTPDPVAANAASLQSGPVAPGEIISIFGEGLGPTPGAFGAFSSKGILGSLTGGTEVLFDSTAAPIYYAGEDQINAQVPYPVAGKTFTQVEVRYQGQTVATFPLAVTEAAPALFGAILNQDGTANAADQPAARETIAVFFGTGEGLTDGANITGQAAAMPYPHPRLPVTLSVGGVPADILYAGSAPGLTGLLQVNARIPGGFVPPGRASVQLTVGSAPAPPITIWLK